MKVLLLLLLASASTSFGKSLAQPKLLFVGDGTANFGIDQVNFNPTTNDYFGWEDIVTEPYQDATGESSEADLAVFRETEDDEPSENDHGDQDEHIPSSDEWIQQWDVENRFRDSAEERYDDGYYNGYEYPRYDYYNPSWWRAQEGPMVVQPIVIPVQFAFGQPDYFRRRIMY